MALDRSAFPEAEGVVLKVEMTAGKVTTCERARNGLDNIPNALAALFLFSPQLPFPRAALPWPLF